MQSNSGRKKVLACLQMKVPLTKSTKPEKQGSSSSSVGGIPELQAVVDIMSRAKAGTTPEDAAACPPANDNTDSQSVDNPDSQPDAAAACPPDADDEDELMPVNLIESEEEEEDPVLVKARELMAQELTSVSVHQSADKWSEEISACVMKHNRAVVVLEAPTSKPAVLHQMLKLKCFPEQFSLWIPVGARLDLLHAMEKAVSTIWPKRCVYTICLGQASQNQRRRSTWGIWMPLDGEKAPAWLDVGGCTSKASECLRYRCNIRCCKFVQSADEAVGRDGLVWGGGESREVGWGRWDGAGWCEVCPMEWSGLGSSGVGWLESRPTTRLLRCPRRTSKPPPATWQTQTWRKALPSMFTPSWVGGCA